MDAKIDGVPFGEIMNQAVKLKTHQAKPDRCKWDSWPKFKQNSMFQRDEIRAARLLPFNERLEAAFVMKREGDKFFRQHNLLDASLKYEYALAVFRYLLNADPGWKKKGILDSDITEHDYEDEQAPLEHKDCKIAQTIEGDEYEVDKQSSGGTIRSVGQKEEWREALHKFYVACYLNLARVYFKNNETAAAIDACEYALGVDPPPADICKNVAQRRGMGGISSGEDGAYDLDNDGVSGASGGGDDDNNNIALAQGCDKALLLRAQVRMSRASAGAVEQDMAIKDVQCAHRILQRKIKLQEHTLSRQRRHQQHGTDKSDEKNGSEHNISAEHKELMKRQREVVRELRKLKGEVEKQRERDKDWGGVFERQGGLKAATEQEQAAAAHARAAAIKAEQEASESEDESNNQMGEDVMVENVLSGKATFDNENTSMENDKKKVMVEEEEEKKKKKKNRKKKAKKLEDIPVPKEVADQLDAMEGVRRRYHAQRRYEEAEAVQKEIDKARAKLDEFRRESLKPRQKRPLPDLDFAALTPEMVADAKKQGIDLEDPDVLKALRGVQEEHKARGKVMTGESIAASLDSRDKAHSATMRKDLAGMLSGMSASELRSTCDVAKVPHVDVGDLGEGQKVGVLGGLRKLFGGGGEQLNSEDRRKLEERLIEVLIERAQKGEGLPLDGEDEDEYEKEAAEINKKRLEERNTRTWRIAFGVTGLLFFLRLLQQGYFSIIWALATGQHPPVKNWHMSQDMRLLREQREHRRQADFREFEEDEF